MVKISKIDSKKGRSLRCVLLWLFTFEVGLHDVNGMHLSGGFGVGPFELSLSFHNWDKW